MGAFVFLKFILTVVFLLTLTNAKDNSMSIYDFSVKTIDEEEISLSKYKNKVLLIVNVASKCGFTLQYEGLQKLYEKYKDKGFMILGFPSNQFSQQEPGSNEEIKSFCTLTYGVKFDMFSKIDVNGKNEIPLYTYLKNEARGILGTKNIKWNFTKILVDKKGNVTQRYGSIIKAEDIQEDIEKLL